MSIFPVFALQVTMQPFFSYLIVKYSSSGFGIDLDCWFLLWQGFLASCIPGMYYYLHLFFLHNYFEAAIHETKSLSKRKEPSQSSGDMIWCDNCQNKVVHMILTTCNSMSATFLNRYACPVIRMMIHLQLFLGSSFKFSWIYLSKMNEMYRRVELFKNEWQEDYQQRSSSKE